MKKIIVLLLIVLIALLGIDIAMRLGLNSNKPEKNSITSIIQPIFRDKINKKGFESLHRSAKAIEGATAVGVNISKFQELLQGMATEIVIISDKLTNAKEKELLLLYAKALEIYKDSETIWGEKIEQSSKYEYPLYKKGYIWVREHYTSPEVMALINKYNIPIVNLQKDYYNKSTDTYISEDSIQLLWGLAGKEIEKANSILNS